MLRIYTRRGNALRRLLAVVLASLLWWALVPGIALADDDDDDRRSHATSVEDHGDDRGSASGGEDDDDDGDEGQTNSRDDEDEDDDGDADSPDESDLSFEAKLRPGQEVPPVVSDGEGQVSFEVNGTTVAFKLQWEDLTTPAVAAHIHCGATGVAGPVGVNLLTTTMGTDGTVKGTFTAPNPGNACGWVTLSDVLSAVLSGNTYVNVHSTMFPAGEIRGQLKQE